MKATRLDWPEIVPPKLEKACGDDMEIVAREVREGISHLYHIVGDGVDLLVVTRGEEYPNGKELVIVCVAGLGMEQVGQFLIDNARILGFDSIRYHCKNQAVQRLYQQYGFAGEEIERVYKVALGGSNEQ